MSRHDTWRGSGVLHKSQDLFFSPPRRWRSDRRTAQLCNLRAAVAAGLVDSRTHGLGMMESHVDGWRDHSCFGEHWDRVRRAHGSLCIRRLSLAVFFVAIIIILFFSRYPFLFSPSLDLVHKSISKYEYEHLYNDGLQCIHAGRQFLRWCSMQRAPCSNPGATTRSWFALSCRFPAMADAQSLHPLRILVGCSSRLGILRSTGWLEMKQRLAASSTARRTILPNGLAAGCGLLPTLG